jgi:hypothetical protein
LLEVLAAVAILGIWFAILASLAIQGLRAEGKNARIVRASLAADTILADLESQIEIGEFPLEEVETELDEFQITTRAIPLAETAAGGEEATDLVTYLGESLGTVNADLYEIEVEVTWIEGVDEQTLVRSSYGWDSAAFMETFGSAASTAEDDADDAGDTDTGTGAAGAGDDDFDAAQDFGEDGG